MSKTKATPIKPKSKKFIPNEAGKVTKPNSTKGAK
jgi:hypothetical protein